jgi:WD40 repeat protein
LELPDHRVFAVAFHPLGREIAASAARIDPQGEGDAPALVRFWKAGGPVGVVRLWDVETGRERPGPSEETSVAWSLSFLPDGRLASGGNEFVRLWDPVAGVAGGPLGGHRGVVGELASHGSLLASAATDGSIRIWDANTGRLVQAIRAPGGQITGLDFSPDGERLATAAADGVRLWDPKLGLEALHLDPPGTTPIDVLFHPDGRQLLMACSDGTIRIWTTASEPTRRIRDFGFEPDRCSSVRQSLLERPDTFAEELQCRSNNCQDLPSP